MIDRFPEINFPKRSLIPWIGKTSKMLKLYIKGHLQERGYEISKEQYILLAHLNHEDGRIQKELAFITDRNKGSLARLVNTAEKKNLVKRVPSKEDKRINRVYLTKNGRAIFHKLKPLMASCEKQVQHGLTAQEYKQLVSLLKKVQKNILK